MPSRRTSVCFLLPLAGLLLLALTAFHARRAVFRAQSDNTELVPFTLESALHYRRIRDVFLGNGIRTLDPDIQAPGGIRTYEIDTVGSEHVVGRLARLLPDLWTLPERVRWLHVAWFSTGIVWMALWIRAASRAWVGGWVAGAFYALSLSAVIRSTGQELSHENVAIPFLLAHLALDALSNRADRRLRISLRIASALALALALCTWDMVQYAIGLKAVWMLLSAARSEPGTWSFCDWIPDSTGLVLVGLLHPYFRFHHFLLSPVFGLCLAAGGVVTLRNSGRLASPVARVVVPLFAAILAWIPSRLGGFPDRYGHFGRLIWAKLRFLNLKPADPALLDFDQRIMWTPALHSATGKLVLQLFPFLLALTLAACVLYYCRSWRRGAESRLERRIRNSLVFYFLVSLFTFAILVRFHVFTAIFCTALVGIAAADMWRRAGVARWGTVVLLAAGLAGESVHTLRDAPKWGRNTSYKELLELGAWLKDNASGDTVLANFGVSAFALTYGGTPIVLHPKFETKDIRERVEKYGTLLFKGTEEDFADWALWNGADLYIYSRGEFAARSPEYQMRYMVNALNPPPGAPALRFERRPNDFRRFEPLWSNARYQVYRIHPDRPR
jgi:hypothetical protein